MSSGSTQNRIDLAELDIKPLDLSLDRAAFCCGTPLLDDFIRHHAAELHAAYKTRVTIAVHRGRIVGYYWLAVQGAAFSDFSKEEKLKSEFLQADLDTMPCIYLGMIATAKDLQGRGIGKTLMIHAMRQTLTIAERVGVYALTLDAVDAQTAERYAAWGFDYFVSGKLWMYFLLPTIRSGGLAPL